MKKTTRFLALVLAAALLLAGVPLSASAATPLPNFKVQGSMVSWDNEFYYTDPYNRKRPLGYSEFEFTGFVPNTSWGVKKDSLTTLQKYCDVQWTLSYVQDPVTEQTSDYIGHISVNIQDLLEYWSAMSNQPLEAGVYSITVQCGDHWDPKASSTFNYAYSLRSTGVHGVYVTGGYPEPKLGKAGELMVVRAQKKSGYTFDHWQVDSGEITLADPHSATTSFSMPDENVMLTPVYFKNATLFAVSFDPNGGSGAMASQSVQAGQLFRFPACAFTPPGRGGL